MVAFPKPNPNQDASSNPASSYERIYVLHACELQTQSLAPVAGNCHAKACCIRLLHEVLHLLHVSDQTVISVLGQGMQTSGKIASGTLHASGHLHARTQHTCLLQQSSFPRAQPNH